MNNLAAGIPLPAREGWHRLLSEYHDVLVVGGGIHGVGVARDAVLRGLRVAVIERSDWASGTSSRSSKLLHGGLRYLRQGSFRLVREALAERELHLRLAPGLVRRLRFRVPPTPPGSPPRWQIRAGIALYDLFTGSRLRPGFLAGEPYYEDAAIDDARFCLEVMLDARRHGALALSYVEWLEWVRQGERVVGARVRDRFTGEEGTVSAGQFVNATGPWADSLLFPSRRSEPVLRLTRGTHLVLKGRADGDARLFFSAQDHRVLFLLPFEGGNSLLGTTDVDEASPIREPIPLDEEVKYLRDAFHAQFPEWKHWRPVGLQCGFRPLLAGDGPPSDLSREERVLIDAGGSLISILGGKYTTFRLVAERVVDVLQRSRGVEPGIRPTREEPIPPSKHPGDDHSRIRHGFAEEDAVRLEDVFFRRTTLGYRGKLDPGTVGRVAKLWRLRWGKGEREAEAEARAFLEVQDRRLAPIAAWDA